MSNSDTTTHSMYPGRDHWQDEKDRLRARLEAVLLGDREELAVQELLARPLPDLLRTAFRYHARSILRRERPLILQGSHQFLLDDPEIRAHLHKLRELLIDRLKLTRAEIRKLIDFGVRLQFDLIARPRATVETLLYQQPFERQRDDIATILVGLGEHRPLLAAILELIDDYPSGPVTKEAFRALCRQAERKTYGEKPVAALLRDLQDLITFRNLVEGTERTYIDGQTVLAMLYERNLKELAESLLMLLSQREAWTLTQIERAMEHQLLVGGLSLSSDEPWQLFLLPEEDLSAFLEETQREVRQRGLRHDTAGRLVAIPAAFSGDRSAQQEARGRAGETLEPSDSNRSGIRFEFAAPEEDEQPAPRHRDAHLDLAKDVAAAIEKLENSQANVEARLARVETMLKRLEEARERVNAQIDAFLAAPQRSEDPLSRGRQPLL